MLKYISEYKKDIPIIDSSKLSIQTEIQLGNLTYEQEEFVEFWEEMLSRRITYKKDIRELVTQSITKIELVRQAIASLEIDGLRLKDVPFMYLIKVYRSIYGRVDVSNFGLDSAKGKQMLELFLEEEHV
jgi:hypothetical protein